MLEAFHQRSVIGRGADEPDLVKRRVQSRPFLGSCDVDNLSIVLFMMLAIRWKSVLARSTIWKAAKAGLFRVAKAEQLIHAEAIFKRMLKQENTKIQVVGIEDYPFLGIARTRTPIRAKIEAKVLAVLASCQQIQISLTWA